MIVWRLLSWLLLLYLLALVCRAVLGWVQVVSRGWRPHGWLLVLAEAVYTVTDPPLRLVGKVVPPLRLGAVAIDIAFSIVFLVCLVLWSVASGLA